MKISARFEMRAVVQPAMRAAKPRRRGTTLVELLVVIVIFLVGILAILNIFPRGLRLLTLQRNSNVAEALARQEIERLRSRPDQLPERIIAVRRVNGVIVEDPERDPADLGPLGDAILPNGMLMSGGSAIGDWLMNSGPNSARRVIHEAHRLSQRGVFNGQDGNLAVVNFGPIDSDGGLVAVANPLNRVPTAPRDLRPQTTTFQGALPRPAGGPVTVPLVLVDSTDRFGAFDFALLQPSSANGTILLPTADQDRTYRLDFTAYVRNGTAVRRLDLREIRLVIPASVAAPLVGLPITSLTSGLQGLGVIVAGDALVGLESDSVSISPEFVQIALTDSFANYPNDPYRFKVLDTSMGVALFSPYANQYRVQRAGGIREQLEARLSYDVLDWRVIREEFRLTEDSNAQLRFRLGVVPLKIGGQPGPDGRVMGGISYETVSPPATEAIVNSPQADHFVLIDLLTGGVVCERDANGNQVVVVNKSTGLVTINPPAGGLQVRLPGGAGLTTVNALNRPVRALYMVRNEWAVQVMKAASEYTVLNESPFQAPGTSQCAIGGTRLYFPASELGKRVTIDSVNYLRTGDTQVHVLNGGDFVVHRIVGDPVGLPAIDIRDVAPDAASLDARFGTPVRGVKGSSLTVRVLWNPDSTTIGTDQIANLQRADQWGRGWRRHTHDTYIQKEAVR